MKLTPAPMPLLKLLPITAAAAAKAAVVLVGVAGGLGGLGALGVISGCAPMSTYPPVETAAATKLTRPTFEPVPTVMAEAIRYAQQRYVPDQDLAINLPQGAPPELYDKVIAKLDAMAAASSRAPAGAPAAGSMMGEALGSGFRPMTSPGEPAIHVQEVRTRMFNAQVDLIYPRGDGFNQMVTITMHRSAFSGYRVISERAWQLRNVMAPMPTYMPPALEPPASDEPAIATAAPQPQDEHDDSDYASPHASAAAPRR